MLVSTLSINNYEELMGFLREIKMLENKEEFPEWMEGIKMFDDNEQLKTIEKNNEIIKDANDNISKAMDAINKNNRYVKVAEYISERMQERQKRTEITQDRVLQELASIAFAKATDYVEIRSNGVYSIVVVKPTTDLAEEQIGAIAGIKEGANGIEIKLNDKEKALEMLGRHLGMWNDKLDILRTP